jgi:hypothetical protein
MTLTGRCRSKLSDYVPVPRFAFPLSEWDVGGRREVRAIDSSHEHVETCTCIRTISKLELVATSNQLACSSPNALQAHGAAN